ncbi:MAG: hypothetical protein PHQ59_02505 [Candidatus Daviesbacteria bacterium]|nr:hypothetical protein [Candidatus Daviesbacteria bacterium]
MKNIIKDFFILTGLTLFLTLIIWLPFYLNLENLLGLNFSAGIGSIYRNFDGLEYVIIAKSLYQPHIIASLPQSLSANYYAAHFPGYAMLILLISPFFGFLKAMLLISVFFTITSVLAFYYLVKDFKLSTHPLLLSSLFLVLPARWLIVHSVGSAEPIFICFTILTFYFFMKFEALKQQKYIWATALFGMLAQFTRPPGILIFIAIGLFVLWNTFFKNKTQTISQKITHLFSYSPLFLIPLTMLGVFYWYSLAYKDFFAYFHSGDNIHLTLTPFQVFNKNQFWVGDIWLEDIVYTFILGFLGAMFLIKQKLYPLAFFVFTYLGASIFVAHRDISRYVLPIFPFVLIAFERLLTSKEFKIVLVIVSLGIYLYAQNFLISNTAPVSNLQLYN